MIDETHLIDKIAKIFLNLSRNTDVSNENSHQLISLKLPQLQQKNGLKIIVLSTFSPMSVALNMRLSLKNKVLFTHTVLEKVQIYWPVP